MGLLFVAGGRLPGVQQVGKVCGMSWRPLQPVSEPGHLMPALHRVLYHAVLGTGEELHRIL